MENNDKPNYFSILPANVRYDEKLTSLEKLLYSEITALSDKSGSCWANNEYFANLFNKNVSTISRNIKKLEKKNYIKILYKKRGTQVVERVISVITNPSITNDKNVNGTNDKKIIGSNDKNVKENNTSINNIKENIKEKKMTKKYLEPLGEFKNVLLTQEELDKLKEKFPNFQDKIEDLSIYLEKYPNKKYSSHYATLLSWYRKEQKERSKKYESNDNYGRL